MKCEKRANVEMFGKMCDVKWIKSYTEIDFKDKYRELRDNGYEVIWKTFEGVIMQYKYQQTDIAILKCKAPIKMHWIEESFIVRKDCI